MNDTPTHYTLQDAADLQRFYNDVSHLKPASPGHDVCTEQGFAAIRSVLENSTPHSSILLISDTPPDPDQRDEVLSVVIAKDLQLHFVLAEGGCISTADDEFDAYRRLAATTGGTVLNSIPSVPNLFAFLMASRAKVSSKSCLHSLIYLIFFICLIPIYITINYIIIVHMHAKHIFRLLEWGILWHNYI